MLPASCPDCSLGPSGVFGLELRNLDQPHCQKLCPTLPTFLILPAQPFLLVSRIPLANPALETPRASRF